MILGRIVREIVDGGRGFDYSQRRLGYRGIGTFVWVGRFAQDMAARSYRSNEAEFGSLSYMGDPKELDNWRKGARCHKPRY